MNNTSNYYSQHHNLPTNPYFTDTQLGSTQAFTPNYQTKIHPPNYTRAYDEAPLYNDQKLQQMKTDATNQMHTIHHKQMQDTNNFNRYMLRAEDDVNRLKSKNDMLNIDKNYTEDKLHDQAILNDVLADKTSRLGFNYDIVTNKLESHMSENAYLRGKIVHGGDTINSLKNDIITVQKDSQENERHLKNFIDNVSIDNRREIVAYEETIKILRLKMDQLVARLEQLENRDNLVKALQNELDIMRVKYKKNMEENRHVIDQLRLQMETNSINRYGPFWDELKLKERELNEQILTRAEPFTQVVYKNDPCVQLELEGCVKENGDLKKELGLIKLKLTSREDEVTRLQHLVDKLRGAEEKFQHSVKFSGLMPDSENMRKKVMGMRANMIEGTLDLYDKVQDRHNKKRMVFGLLKFVTKHRRMQRLNIDLQDRNTLFTLQKDVKNPIYVWDTLKTSLIDWVYSLFCASNDSSYKYKQNSFIMFKANMEEATKSFGSMIQLIFTCYRRLMHIVKDYIPRFSTAKVHDKVYFLNDCCPLKEIRAYESNFADSNSKWFEDKLSEVLNKRMGCDSEIDDKEILSVFRLLALKFRQDHSLTGGEKKVDPNLNLFFEIWTVACLIDYFIHQGRQIGLAKNVNTGKTAQSYKTDHQVQDTKSYNKFTSSDGQKLNDEFVKDPQLEREVFNPRFGVNY